MEYTTGSGLGIACNTLRMLVYGYFILQFFPDKLFLGRYFLARQDNCLESYCHDPSVSIGVTPQGKNFNLGYIF
jgi:hypothetical protein